MIRGRNTDAQEDGVYHRLARAGRRVYAADVRGIGDCRPEVGRGNANYTIEHDGEEAYAWASLILGEPLLAQRITDIVALLRAVGNELPSGDQRVSIAARGRLTVPALFAFASFESAVALYMAVGLASFESVLQTENYQQPLANFAWNLFQSTDLPLLAAQAAPRRIHLAGAVDGSNNRMSVDEVRRFYSSDNVRISSDATWDESVLAAV